MRTYAPLPGWLYRMSFGLADFHKLRVLIDGKRFAVVQDPGSQFMNGQESQYGCTTYHLVDKEMSEAECRSGSGLIQTHVLQNGGRAKLAEWMKLVQQVDKTPDLLLAMTKKPKTL